MTGVVEVLSTIGTAVANAAPSAATVSRVASYVGPFAALASAGLTIASSQQQAAMFGAQAQANRVAAGQTIEQGELAARQEELRGRQVANQVREALLRTVATQRARYAAAGLVRDDGTPADVEEDTRQQAERELDIQRGNAEFRAATTRLDAARRAGNLTGEARLLTSRGGSAGMAGLGSAGASLFDYADRWTNRQPGTVRPGRAGASGVG